MTLSQFLISQLQPLHPHTAYVVSSSAPSVQRSKALRADTLFANSTMPLPVGRPRSSVTTMARSTGPNWENACGWKAVHGLNIHKWTQRVGWHNIPLPCTSRWREFQARVHFTCSSSSLVTTGSRFRTVRAALCVAKRILIGRLFKTVPSSSALAISASVRVSWKTVKDEALIYGVKLVAWKLCL